MDTYWEQWRCSTLGLGLSCCLVDYYGYSLISTCGWQHPRQALLRQREGPLVEAVPQQCRFMVSLFLHPNSLFLGWHFRVSHGCGGLLWDEEQCCAFPLGQHTAHLKSEEFLLLLKIETQQWIHKKKNPKWSMAVLIAAPLRLVLRS